MDGDSSAKDSQETFADHWQYVGIAVEEPGYTIWGTSPIIGDDEKIHLFVARWPGAKVEPGWRTSGEIAEFCSSKFATTFLIAEKSLQFQTDREENFNEENNFRVSPVTWTKKKKEKRGYPSNFTLGDRNK